MEEQGELRPDGGDPGDQTPRAKAVMLVVVAVVMVATLVLCCATIGQLGALIQLRLPPP